MQPFSFLHCGDVHLGAPFRGLTDPSPALAERIRDAPADAFRRLVDVAVERRVAAVLIAGDLFDAADRNLRAQIQLRDQLGRLDEAGIRTFIAAGNHDPLGGRVASISYPDSVHWFGDRVEEMPLEVDGNEVARIWGISYGQPEVRDNLSRRFPADPDGPFRIALLHANVGDRPGHGRYAPCSLDDLTSRRFDYWALGHVHKRETLRSDRPVIHYPGNTQGLHRKETGRRGATVVEVSAGGDVRLSPVWTDVVRWHRPRTPIDDLEGLDDLIGAFDELAGELASAAPDRIHVVLWTLAGRGPLHAELRRPDVVPDLVDSLRRQHTDEAVEGNVWLEQLDVETRPRRDLESLRQQQDLLGDLLRLAAEARRHPPAPPTREIGVGSPDDSEPTVSVALRETLEQVLEDRRLWNALDEDPWETLDWPRLLHRAEMLAVEQLADQGAGAG